MNTYIFSNKYSSAVITLSAETEEEAYTFLRDITQDDGFRLSEEVEE